VSKSLFKSKALEFFRQVEASGEPVIVTDHGEPRLEVRRYQAQIKNPLEKLRGTVLHFDRPTEPISEEDWEATQ
jgi:antitoxin (DNA-binding transcriptional repressor) of toxin-antitoxin stability system